MSDQQTWINEPLNYFVKDMNDGGTPSRAIESNFGGDIPWVVITDVKREIYKTKENLSSKGLASCTSKLWPVDTAILSTGATIGKVGLAKVPLATKQGITGIVANEKILPEFLYYELLFKKSNIVAWAQGSTFAEIRTPILGKIPLNIPKDKLVQSKISEILETTDIAIEKTEALIEKYQNIKAGLMHDLFTRGITADGKLRPPREEAPELYQETSIGWIPKDWKARKLKNILLDSGGYLQTGPFGSQLHAHEYILEGIPVVMPQDINEGKIMEDDIARISEERAITLQRHRLKIGDIIIARRGELGRAAAISSIEKGWVCGTGCFLLRLGDSSLDARFFSDAYRHDMIQRQVDGLAVGTTMPSLNNEIMGKLIFPDMSIDEQHRISERIGVAEAEIYGLAKQMKKLINKKSGLMHDLLTGKIEISIDESGIANAI